MSIISLPRQHLKHRPAEAALLGPLAKRPANAPSVPVERPRGVDPARVPLAPGAPARAIAVLNELRADTNPTAQALHAVDMVIAPLRDLLALQMPELTDWLYQLGRDEADEIGRTIEWGARRTVELDDWHNAYMRRAFDVTREVIFGARDLCEQLVADVAGNIADLVALAEVTV